MENKKIFFRFATEEDAKDLFNWRNDPETRKVSFSSNEISWEEHINWFAKSLMNPNRNLFIIIDDKLNKIGQIRFDKDGKEAEISIVIAPEFRGKGYGTQALTNGCKIYLNNNDVDHIIAKIKKTNMNSKKSFENAGFKLFKEHEDHLEFRLLK